MDSHFFRKHVGVQYRRSMFRVVALLVYDPERYGCQKYGLNMSLSLEITNNVFSAKQHLDLLLNYRLDHIYGSPGNNRVSLKSRPPDSLRPKPEFSRFTSKCLGRRCTPWRCWVPPCGQCWCCGGASIEVANKIAVSLMLRAGARASRRSCRTGAW